MVKLAELFKLCLSLSEISRIPFEVFIAVDRGLTATASRTNRAIVLFDICAVASKTRTG